MNKIIVHRHSMVVIAFLVFASLTSCAFLGGYNARSHEYVTSLKAANLKIITDSTAGPGKKFSEEAFESEVSSAELKFQEAIEYSASLQDRLRTSNIRLLHDDFFVADSENIRTKHRLLNVQEAELLRNSTARAYERVLAGECARPEAKCN